MDLEALKLALKQTSIDKSKHGIKVNMVFFVEVVCWNVTFAPYMSCHSMVIFVNL